MNRGDYASSALTTERALTPSSTGCASPPLLVVALMLVVGGSAIPAAAQTRDDVDAFGGDAMLGRPARLDVEDMELQAALALLHRSAGVPLLYSPSLMPGKTVDCPCMDASVSEALTRLLDETGLTFEAYGRQVIILPPAGIPRKGSRRPDAEPRALDRKAVDVGDGSTRVRAGDVRPGALAGHVIESDSGDPLASAQIYLPGLNIGGLSGRDGRFHVDGVPPGRHRIAVERIGFGTISRMIVVAPGETTFEDFRLFEQPLRLDEMFVTGTPGGTRVRAIGNAVSTVRAPDIVERSRLSTMQELLTGQVPSLDFRRRSGNVGTGSPIQIRGVSSLALDQQPLIYVDGVRVNNTFTAGPFLGGGSGPRVGQASALDDFSPEEIETVEVIKGPAAATLYGTEASAGVIQIITKRGSEGAPEVGLSVSGGVNYMANPSAQFGTQWGVGPSGELVAGFEGYPNLYEYEKRVNGVNLFTYGPTQAYNMDLQGGTDRVRAYLAGGWSREVGVVDYNWSDRLNVRGNMSIVFSDELTLDVSTGYSLGKTSFAQQLTEPGGIYEAIMWAQPELLHTDRRGFMRYTPEELATVEATRAYGRVTGSATVTHRYGDWFTQRLVLGLDRSNEENQVLVPRHPQGTASAFGGLGLGDVQLNLPKNKDWTLDYAASAEYGGPGTMSFRTSIGAQYYQSELNEIIGEGAVLASPTIRSIDGASRVSLSQLFVENKSLGVYVQEEINWNDRIFLTGALRADDNSAFGSGFDAAVYPKVSGTWIASDERFWSVPFVSTLRLRAALGQAGRQPSTFDGVTFYSVRTGRGLEPAMVPANLGNPDVGPEVGTELEVGTDFGLLGDRVSGSFTYFHQWTRDALVNIPLKPSQGFSGTEPVNLGRLNNWGWEAELRARVVNAESWSFDVGLGGDHSMNKLVSLGGLPPTPGVREGFPYPVETSAVIVSAEFDDLGNPVNVLCDSGTGPLGLERGGPPLPCSELHGKELLLGTSFPQHRFRADVVLSLLDHDLQLFALAEGEHQVWRGSTIIWCRFAGCFTNARVSLALDDPIYVEGQVFQQRYPRDDTLVREYDGSFWKLRRLGARYTVPDAVAHRLYADRLSLSVAGANLWTLWRKTKELSGAPVPDPELTGHLGGTDSDLGMMPPLASVSLRLDVTF